MNRQAFLLALLLPSTILARTPVATPAGAPVNCVTIRSIDRTVVRDDRTIDFLMLGTPRVYRNSLPQACPELANEGAFSYETSQSVLCDVDIITVFRQTGPIRRGASCGLGQFQPVSLAK
jgi:hypothetical protein